jgi:hypothetical protein
MKRILQLAFLLFIFGSAQAQVTIRVPQIMYPPFNSSDSAYEDSTYNFPLYILNYGTTITLVDFFDVYMQKDSNAIDTLINAAVMDSIAPQDSITKQVTSFQFSSVNLDDGDNIVVVWPVARIAGESGDSSSYHIYFVSATGIEKLQHDPVTLYPNPATDYIYFKDDGQNSITRVRIYDLNGKLFYEKNRRENLIPVGKFDDGIYMISIERKDGTRQTFRFVKS